METIYFSSAAEMGQWLKQHHTEKNELQVGYYKKHTGKPSLSWEESVEEALCYGWIDGIRKSVDGERYTIRFTPRKPDSNWSRKNIDTAERLIKDGRMQHAGMAIYKKRKAEKSGVYSFEREKMELYPEFLHLFQQNEKAWDYYSAQAPSYRKTAVYWVMSAKQEKTRLKRLNELIDASSREQKPAPFLVGRK